MINDDLTKSEIELLNNMEEFYEEMGPMLESALTPQEKKDADSLVAKGHFKRVPEGYTFISKVG